MRIEDWRVRMENLYAFTINFFIFIIYFLKVICIKISSDIFFEI